MEKEGKAAGFRLEHGHLEGRHSYRVIAELKPSSGLFFQHSLASAVLNGRESLHCGYIWFSRQPGSNVYVANVYPFINLKKPEAPKGKHIARNLELLASRDFRRRAGSVSVKYAPEKFFGEGRKYLARTGRGLLQRWLNGGLARTYPIDVSIRALEKSIKKGKK